jgi:GNAT superfamily N-acetyltransferase
VIELVEAAPWLDGDERWVASEGHDVRADVTLWWKTPPPHLSRRVGFLGRYSAVDRDAGRGLLLHAGARLRENGCDLAIGPIDGNTWRSYRLVVESDGTPAFLLEPENPPEWPHDFADAGFTQFARYRSHRDRDLQTRDPRCARLESQFSALGVSLRNLDAANFEREMRAVFELCITSFRQNLLYSPIEIEEFLAMYAQIRPLIDPRLCLLAEHDGRLVGFAFALNDARGPSERNAIIKTIARDPHRRYAGLGPLLSDRIRLAVHEAGFAGAIHALMHESNTSLAISRRFGDPFRTYALFAKDVRG